MNLSHKLKKEVKKNKFQFTFFSEKHKPVACILETDKDFVEVIRDEATFRRLAVVKVCQKRAWTHKDFKSYGYDWKFKYKRIKE